MISAGVHLDMNDWCAGMGDPFIYYPYLQGGKERSVSPSPLATLIRGQEQSLTISTNLWLTL